MKRFDLVLRHHNHQPFGQVRNSRTFPAIDTAPSLERCFANSFGLRPYAANTRQKMARQNRDILGMVAERRHGEWDHIQAIEEIFAESSARDLVFEVSCS